MLDKYKLSSEQLKNVDAISNIATKKQLYNEFVQSQESGFIRFMQYINHVIKYLQQKGQVSEFLEIRARIKHTNSALKNDKEKILDDVFGIEIICDKEQELENIQNEIEKIMKSTRSKDHNKDNGYKAIHRCYSLNPKKQDNTGLNLKDSYVPAVECQFKTMKVENNPNASHHDYKKVDKEETQQLLETKVLKIGEEIPRMWALCEGQMVELSYKEIIRRIYPFIDLTKIKEPEIDIKEK